MFVQHIGIPELWEIPQSRDQGSAHLKSQYLGIQGHSQLCSELRASLGHETLSKQKKKKKKVKRKEGKKGEKQKAVVYKNE